jgi:hypothetical protein
MPRLRHSPDGRSRYHPPPKHDADPRTGAIHALQGLLTGPALSLQAQPSGRAAADKDIGERSAIDMVAGGKMMQRDPHLEHSILLAMEAKATRAPAPLVIPGVDQQVLLNQLALMYEEGPYSGPRPRTSSSSGEVILAAVGDLTAAGRRRFEELNLAPEGDAVELAAKMIRCPASGRASATPPRNTLSMLNPAVPLAHPAASSSCYR